LLIYAELRIMATKEDLIGNELMKELISIRADTLWRMLALKAEGGLPRIEDEGATGEFDNKGALFVPGGLIYSDVDENPIHYKAYGDKGPKEFSKKIRSAMSYDNATLIHPDGMATSVNLNNGFFSRAARKIFAYKKAAMKRIKRVKEGDSFELSSDDITRSQCPNYIREPYGARTRLSACISVGLTEAPMFFAYCKTELGLNSEEERAFSSDLDQAQEPVLGKDKTILAPPFIVVCHDTRYREDILTGIIRILGIGKFGEFATITLEPATKAILQETRRRKEEFSAAEIFAEYKGIKTVGVLRIYAPTTPGKRSLKTTTRLISPANDLGLDLQKIEEEARERYRIA
jgi:hypothetical protein